MRGKEERGSRSVSTGSFSSPSTQSINFSMNHINTGSVYRGGRGTTFTRGGMNSNMGGFNPNRNFTTPMGGGGFQGGPVGGGFQPPPMGNMQPYGGFNNRGGMLGNNMRGGPGGMRGRGGMGGAGPSNMMPVGGVGGMGGMGMGGMGMGGMPNQMGGMMGQMAPNMGMQGTATNFSQATLNF